MASERTRSTNRPDTLSRTDSQDRRLTCRTGADHTFFRKPYGPGWALVGDAGYNKDPITAQGISDAFRDAERCATALDQAFKGARPFDDAMAEYQRERDEGSMPMYEFTCELATLEPPPPQMQQLFDAIRGNQKAMDGFAQMNAGTISPADFGAVVAAAHVSS